MPQWTVPIAQSSYTSNHVTCYKVNMNYTTNNPVTFSIQCLTCISSRPWTHYTAHTSLELAILLPLLPKYWNYRNEPFYLTFISKTVSEIGKPKTCVVAHTFNLGAQELETGGLYEFEPGLHNEFQDCIRPCLKKKKIWEIQNTKFTSSIILLWSSNYC